MITNLGSIFGILLILSIHFHEVTGLCEDTTGRFKVVKRGLKGWTKFKSCKWVKRKSTSFKCRHYTGVKEACPKTCTNCCKERITKFLVPELNKLKTCAWVRKRDTASRCRKIPSHYCPVTCGLCANDRNATSVSVEPTETAIKCPNGKNFEITLVNTGTNSMYDSAFAKAKARWESIIKCDLPDMSQDENFDWFAGLLSQPYNTTVDDIVIGYEIKFIDGQKGILGSAGPIYFRNGKSSPISGRMIFDEDDFAIKSESK